MIGMGYGWGEGVKGVEWQSAVLIARDAGEWDVLLEMDGV
jgi:hypothetical protein